MKIRWRLHGDETEPTTRQRGYNVYRELQRQGVDADAWDGCSPADIIVLQYDMTGLDTALKCAPVVVADINDMLFADWHGHRQGLLNGLKRVHGVVAGSPRLGQHLARMHPHVKTIDEPVDPKYYEVKPVAHKGLNVFWMGLHDNLTFFGEIDEVLAQLAKRHDFTVHIVCPPQDGTGNSNAAKVVGKPYQTEYHIWTAETVLSVMSTCDIGVAPLFQNEWCACKCNNKVTSMMAAGLPVVCSAVTSYNAIIGNGENGFACLCPDEWHVAIDYLIVNGDEREHMAQAGKITAQKFTVAKIARQWADWLAELHPM